MIQESRCNTKKYSPLHVRRILQLESHDITLRIPPTTDVLPTSVSLEALTTLKRNEYEEMEKESGKGETGIQAPATDEQTLRCQDRGC